MRLGQDVHGEDAALPAREWLLANGVGGSASGTAAGTAPRASHVWLTAGGGGAPRVLLLGAAERLRTAAGAFDLAGAASAATAGAPSAARPAVIAPEGFTFDSLPVWTWRAGDSRLERALFLISGHDAVAVRYRLLEGPPATLTVSPLVAARAPHESQRQDTGFRGASQSVPGRIRIELPEPDRALTLFHNGAFLPARLWRPLEHAAEPEAARREEACVPGYVEATLTEGTALVLVAGVRDDLFRALAAEDRLGAPPPRTLAECVQLLERHEREERERWGRAAKIGADLTAQQARLAHGGAAAPAAIAAPETIAAPEASAAPGAGWTVPLAATLLDGLARRGARLTLLASLPGASECGSDALRALPGLLAIRAFEPVRDVLRGYAEYLDEGLAPESFAPDGTPRYGDPRPALWLVHAAELYTRRSGDLEFARAVLLPACESIVQFHRAGTHHGVSAAADGLLAQGAGNVRELEANILWSHALVAAAQIARVLGQRESAAFHLAWAHDHQQRFLDAFWDEKTGVPFARIEGGRGVPGFTPAALLAASLSPPLLPADRLASLVAATERDLLTPWGLREAPGAGVARPAALGAYVTACLRADGRSAAAMSHASAALTPLRAWLASDAHPGIPEGFDLTGFAAAPQPDGHPGALAAPPACGDPVSIVASAELLRAWTEDLEHASFPAAAPV